MSIELTSEQVWAEVEKEIFGVLGMVTARGEARTVGVVYAVHDHRLYIATEKDAWKTRHVRGNPHVSMTVVIPKRIPFWPWVKIPAATITFSGLAAVRSPEEVDADVLRALLRGLETDDEMLATLCVIEVQPVKDFVTYGVGVSLMTMRHPEKASGRAPVAPGAG